MLHGVRLSIMAISTLELGVVWEKAVYTGVINEGSFCLVRATSNHNYDLWGDLTKDWRYKDEGFKIFSTNENFNIRFDKARNAKNRLCYRVYSRLWKSLVLRSILDSRQLFQILNQNKETESMSTSWKKITINPSSNLWAGGEYILNNWFTSITTVSLHLQSCIHF